MFWLIGNASGAITEHSLPFQDWMLETAFLLYSEWMCKVTILEMAPEEWQMAFQMQHNDHYKMRLYLVLELLCTFYWDRSEDLRDWGFISQPKPSVDFVSEAFGNLKSCIFRTMLRKDEASEVDWWKVFWKISRCRNLQACSMSQLQPCSSWWSSGCHGAESQQSEFRLMLDWQFLNSLSVFADWRSCSCTTHYVLFTLAARD